jgi:preprotein translocase subunit SecE
VATARGARHEDNANPLEHATPDVELAEAQLAVGRPELAGEAPDEPEFSDPELTDDAFDGDAGDDGFCGGSGGGGGGGSALARGDDGGRRGSGSVAVGAVSAHSPWAGARLVGFVQGSWRELQRVQWPDRRQVMQATGVVIGFVIVAGLFLGAADWVAQRLVTLILK